MESIDRQILALLAVDGRMSYTDIGRETGLSTSAAQQRVRRLEQRGIISGYRAVIDPASLGRTLTAFISVRPIDPASDENVALVLTSYTEITDFHSVAGESTFLVKAQVADPAQLDHLLTRMRSEARVTTVTTIVLTTYFTERPLAGEREA